MMVNKTEGHSRVPALFISRWGIVRNLTTRFPIPLMIPLMILLEVLKNPISVVRAAFDSVRLLNRGAENTVKGL